MSDKQPSMTTLLTELNARLASIDARLADIEERQKEDGAVLDDIDTRLETVENVMNLDVGGDDTADDPDTYPGDLT